MAKPKASGIAAKPKAFAPGDVAELEITALAYGGAGVGRDANGRVMFVPRTAIGDRVRAKVARVSASFANGVVVERLADGPDRVPPPCPSFVAGCGGCAWQHIARPAQLAVLQSHVEGALRRIAGVRVHPIEAPVPSLGWRRRARLHASGGEIGLYRAESHFLQPLAACPQLEPALDAVLGLIAKTPPDSELLMARSHDGRIALNSAEAWPAGAALVGAQVVGADGSTGVVTGVDAGGVQYGERSLEIEPGLRGTAGSFAQASAAGNAALIERVRAIVGTGPGRLLELYAGSGNFTRALIADDWDVTASDVVAPAQPLSKFVVGQAHTVLAQPEAEGPWDALVMDPPRTGAKLAIPGILAAEAETIAYVSCDVPTLARDVEQLVAGGYEATDAWPFDIMPNTAHVEVVMRLVRK